MKELTRRLSFAKQTVKDFSPFTPHSSLKFGFTLAEVLITLGIIGVVAAITIPTLISTHKKQVIETSLKQSYSIISQVLERAQADYGDISTWDYKNMKYFAETYIVPYVKTTGTNFKISDEYNNFDTYILQLANGTEWKFRFYSEWGDAKDFVRVRIDVNGGKKPNMTGKDIFDFYIFPEAKHCYNGGDGDIAYNVPRAGIYYDGYGVSDNDLRTGQYRGCSHQAPSNASYPNNGFCVAIIARNGWKIPDDYPIRL